MTRRGLRSAFLCGHLWHKRFRPKEHSFSYKVFYCLIDLDEADGLAQSTRFFSVGGANLVSFYPEDHGIDKKQPPAKPQNLKEQVICFLRNQFNAEEVSRVELLTMPRIVGYVFNPISVYYCYDGNDQLVFVIYEVNNTFGERFSYAFRTEQSGTKVGVHTCNKQLHVSPFFSVTGAYEFRQSKSDKLLSLSIDYHAEEEKDKTDTTAGVRTPKSFSASMQLKNQNFSTRNLMLNALCIPFMAIKVVAAIHWQALLLWLKKIEYFSKPDAPEELFRASKHPAKGQSS